MIITYSTGSEPEHKVAININYIAYLTPHHGFTDIHLTNGEKFMVDGKFNEVVDLIRTTMEHKP